MNTFEYLFKNAFWALASMVLYKTLVSLCLPDETINYSKILLWILVIVSVVIGIVFTYKCRRNDISIFVNTALPFEAFSLIAYRKIYPTTCIVIFILSCALAVIYVAVVLFRKIEDKSNLKRIIWIRIKGSFLRMRTIIATFLILAMLPIGVATMFKASNSNAIISKLNECTIENNMNIMPDLLPENWENLSTSQRLTALQVLANVEANYHGLDFELNVIAENLDENILGLYNHNIHTISIDSEYLAECSSDDAIRTICHEGYHAYERCLVSMYQSIDPRYKDLIMFYDIPYYEANFNNYIDGDENFFGYYIQSIEIDARNYAEIAVEEIYRAIRKNLNKQV